MTSPEGKLVRDLVPELIKAGGGAAQVRVLDDEEFDFELMRKLREEVAEFEAARSVEELVDVLEVVYAIAGRLGCSVDALEESRRGKARIRGGFGRRLFLEAAGDLRERGATPMTPRSGPGRPALAA